MKGLSFYDEIFLTIKEDEEILKENITRILLTSPGERVNNPLFGSNLRNFLFDLGVVMREEVESDIISSITKWEPRVLINSITTEERPTENTFVIHLECTNKDTLEELRLIRF
ncbi:MAG: GPW/gp25 family protein [Dehalococcoidales bacterium]|nr:GPW/gp25 family protein [Dehalococcoidales bacterium]